MPRIHYTVDPYHAITTKQCPFGKRNSHGRIIVSTLECGCCPDYVGCGKNYVDCKCELPEIPQDILKIEEQIVARDIAQFINANTDKVLEIKTRDSLEIIENALYGVTSADFKKVIIFTDDREEGGKRCANFQEFDANEIVEVSAR